MAERTRLDESAIQDLIKKLDRNEITEDSIKKSLNETIEAHGVSAEELEAAQDGAGKKAGGPRKRKGLDDAPPMFLVPLAHLDNDEKDIQHPLFTFRPIKPPQEANS
jgi:cell envelope opacity-associated protein A